MPERGILTINAPDGTVIASITHDASETPKIAERAFQMFGTGQGATEMVDQLNDTFGLETDQYFRRMGTEWLTNVKYFYSDTGSHEIGAAVKQLRDIGPRDFRFSIFTREGAVYLLSPEGPVRVDPGRFTRNPSKRTAKAESKRCTCRRR